MNHDWGDIFPQVLLAYDEEISKYFYLMKGTEIIVPEKALVFKRYCAWSYKIEKSNYSSDQK